MSVVAPWVSLKTEFAQRADSSEKRTKQVGCAPHDAYRDIFAPAMASPIPDISPRHRFEARVSISVQRGQHELSLQGWVRDLSESGLRAFVADSLLPGESVTFEIPLCDAGNQVIPATVMRALGTDYGFQFTALSAEQRNQIQATLRESPVLPRPQAGNIWS